MSKWHAAYRNENGIPVSVGSADTVETARELINSRVDGTWTQLGDSVYAFVDSRGDPVGVVETVPAS